jgi:hypothetical protein
MSEIVEQISLEIIFYGTGHKQLSMFCIWLLLLNFSLILLDFLVSV